MKKALVTLVALLTVLFVMTACSGNLVVPSMQPTVDQTDAPTDVPTAAPTVAPTTAPTAAPTAAPTTAPTAAPTVVPTVVPTVAPTAAPTDNGLENGEQTVPTHAGAAPTAARPDDGHPTTGGDKPTDEKTDTPKEPVDETVVKTIQEFLNGAGDATLTPELLKEAIPTYDELMALLLPAEGMEAYLANIKTALDNLKCEIGDIRLNVNGVPSSPFGESTKINYIGLKDGQLVVMGDELVDGTWVPAYAYITYTDGSVYAVSAMGDMTEYFQFPVDDMLVSAFDGIEPMLREEYDMYVALLEEAIDSAFSLPPADVQLPAVTAEDLEAVEGKFNTYRLTKAYVISLIDALNARTDINGDGIIVSVLPEDTSNLLKAFLSFGDAYPYFIVEDGGSTEVSGVGFYAEADFASTIFGAPEGNPSYIDICCTGEELSLVASVELPNVLSLFASIQENEQEFSAKVDVNVPSALEMKLDASTTVVYAENGMPKIDSKLQLDVAFADMDAIPEQSYTEGLVSTTKPSSSTTDAQKDSTLLNQTAESHIYVKEEDGKLTVVGKDENHSVHEFIGNDASAIFGDKVEIVEGTSMPLHFQLVVSQKLDLSKLMEANAEIFECRVDVMFTASDSAEGVLEGEDLSYVENILLSVRTEEAGVYVINFRQDDEESNTTFSLRFAVNSAENFPEIPDEVLSYVEQMKNDPTLGALSFDNSQPPMPNPGPNPGDEGVSNGEFEKEHDDNGSIITDKNDALLDVPFQSADEGEDISK